MPRGGRHVGAGLRTCPTSRSRSWSARSSSSLPVARRRSSSPRSSRRAATPSRCGGGSSQAQDRKSTRLNSSHSQIPYAVFCLKKKKSAHTSALFFPPTCTPTSTLQINFTHHQCNSSCSPSLHDGRCRFQQDSVHRHFAFSTHS